jgi:hypothetical protein
MHSSAAGHYIHCGQPMQKAGTGTQRFHSPITTGQASEDVLAVYLSTRVLRCSCGFQMELPEEEVMRSGCVCICSWPFQRTHAELARDLHPSSRKFRAASRAASHPSTASSGPPGAARPSYSAAEASFTNAKRHSLVAPVIEAAQRHQLCI